MKRTSMRFAFALLIALVAGHAFAVNPGNLNAVTIVNHTGSNIYFLFFTPSDSNLWGADILGSTRSLNDGEEVNFFVHYPDRAKAFSILAIDEDGDAYSIPEFVITDGKPASLDITPDYYEGGYDLDSTVKVDLTNDSGYDMWYLFFSPSDSEIWGVDMLGAEYTLKTGETLSLFVQANSTTDHYYVVGIDEDANLYNFSIALSVAQNQYQWSIELSDLM